MVELIAVSIGVLGWALTGLFAYSKGKDLGELKGFKRGKKAAEQVLFDRGRAQGYLKGRESILQMLEERSFVDGEFLSDETKVYWWTLAELQNRGIEATPDEPFFNWSVRVGEGVGELETWDGVLVARPGGKIGAWLPSPK